MSAARSTGGRARTVRVNTTLAMAGDVAAKAAAFAVVVVSARLLPVAQFARLGEVPDFQVEGICVGLASEVAAPLNAALAPAHTPRSLAARMDSLVNAHAATPEPGSRRRARSPFGAGARAGRGSVCAAGSTWLASIQRSTSSGVIRSREQSFDARSSPRSIAR